MNWVLIGLIILAIVQNILHYAERKDLYNRIMCKDFNEYKRKDEVSRQPKTPHQRILEEWRKEK